MIISYQNETNSISEGDFEGAVDSFLSQFESPPFWEEQKYLVYFHGKDLQKAITKQLNVMNLQISWDSYYRFAIDKINFINFPDYDQFVQILIKAADQT